MPLISHGDANVEDLIGRVSSRDREFIGKLETTWIRSCRSSSRSVKKNSRRYIRISLTGVNYFPSKETCRTPGSLLIPPFSFFYYYSNGLRREGRDESKSDENIPVSPSDGPP